MILFAERNVFLEEIVCSKNTFRIELSSSVTELRSTFPFAASSCGSLLCDFPYGSLC